MGDSNTTGVPTPNHWLESKLRDLNMSNSGLARLIGRSRTEVQRWVNSREQIPRHHLAEIAAQLGTPDDLEHAIRLKECEDFADILRRRLRELARISGSDPAKIENATFDLLRRKTSEECAATPDDYTVVLLYNMTHASFVFRQWCDATATRDFSSILDPGNMKLHIRYPANHFLGLALNLDAAGGVTAECQKMGITYLRKLAAARESEDSLQLPSQHAVHMLARFGTAADQAMVNELIENDTTSSDPLCVRLGYAGLIQRPEREHLVEKYTWMLQHDDALAFVDLLFEAVHYGDASLGPDRTMPRTADHFEKSLASIVRRLEQPHLSEAIRNLECFRIISIMDRIGPAPFHDPSLASRLRNGLEGLTSGVNSQSEVARKRLARITNDIDFLHE